MRVDVSSVLACNSELAWDEVRRSRLLVEVAAPLVAIRPASGEELPAVWPADSLVLVRSFLFGFIPTGTRSVQFERIDAENREIETHEQDLLVRRWDHFISIQPLPDDCCLYRDRIEIRAGLFTAAVWLFAQWFYRHRQRRWKAVARRLQSQGSRNPR